MIINHTSPEQITEIKESYSFFRGALFFSNDVYTMTTSSEIHLYQIDLKEEDVIEFGELTPTDNVLNELKHDVSCLFDLMIDDDTATDLLLSNEYDEQLDIIQDLLEKENRSVCEIGYEYISELSWNIQGLQALCAKEMGFLACQSEDEQGTVYAINLINLESRLTYKGTI